MKIEELKHNHSLTDLLKVLLFALLMLAPIGSVLTRSLYVICNKNAYQSYYGETINETQFTNDLNTIKANSYYYFSTTIPSSANNSEKINVNGIENLSGVPTNNHMYLNQDDITSFGIYYNSGTQQYSIRYYIEETAYYFTYYATSFNNVSFNFYASADTTIVNLDLKTDTYLVTFNKDSYLDNVFEYSVSKLATDQMFTWTTNTPVFTGVQAMCTQLGITAPAIPIIIAYWLILTCVYIVIDIVIKLITYITHLIGARKGS